MTIKGKTKKSEKRQATPKRREKEGGLSGSTSERKKQKPLYKEGGQGSHMC